MSDEFKDMVREFATTFQVPTDREFCKKLVEEEAAEVHEAAVHLLKELSDLLYVAHWADMNGHKYQDDLPEHLLSSLRVMEGMVVALGHHTLDNAFRRVHESNMSKLLPDGTVLRREDGKVLKGPHYLPPHLEDLI